MKYPKLVRNGKTPLHVRIEAEGVSEDGEPIVAAEGDFTGNWQDGAKTILTKEQKQVRLSGRAYIDGDVAPQLAEISGGTLTVFGAERQIVRGQKHRNPDGSVNFTELDVM